jgi:exodeoxyribonuclease-3
MKTLRLLSWNVNGIRAMAKKGFEEKVKEINPDILCIQETKAQDGEVKPIAESMNGYRLYVTSAVQKGYSGTAVLSRIAPAGHQYGLGLEEHDQEGRVITLDFDSFYLVNAYVPNSGQELKRLNYRAEWDYSLLTHLKLLDAKKPVIFTGDLNVAHEPIDLARPEANYNKTAGYTQVEIDGFDNLIQAGLVDTFRKLNPGKVQYSYWSQRINARASNLGWRIDYFLVSERIMAHVKDAFILDQVQGSDHCPVGIEIAL